MPDLTEENVAEWLVERDELLERAIEEIEQLVAFFVADWGNTWEFAVEKVENVRIKDAPRIAAKANRRGCTDPDQLLERCFDKDGRKRFPVHDLLGVRVLVRSLNEVAAVKRAVEDLQEGGGGELYPFGNPEDFDAEDINADPRYSGYRALHIEGSVTRRVGEADYVVPFEIQFKTLAQHVYGQHTHDEAYVPDAENQDPRYDLVKGLQRALAETLNGADLLLAQIEDIAAAVRDDIALREAGPEVTAASVANTARQMTGLKLREREAARVAELARAGGITATEEFAALIDPSGDRAGTFADRFEGEHRRRPTMRELIEGLVAQAGGDEGAPVVDGADEESEVAARLAEETVEDKVALEARLAEEPPASALDELDPSADVVVPETCQNGPA